MRTTQSTILKYVNGLYWEYGINGVYKSLGTAVEPQHILQTRVRALVIPELGSFTQSLFLWGRSLWSDLPSSFQNRSQVYFVSKFFFSVLEKNALKGNKRLHQSLLWEIHETDSECQLSIKPYAWGSKEQRSKSGWAMPLRSAVFWGRWIRKSPSK